MICKEVTKRLRGAESYWRLWQRSPTVKQNLFFPFIKREQIAGHMAGVPFSGSHAGGYG